jgi:hypothetical protein
LSIVAAIGVSVVAAVDNADAITAAARHYGAAFEWSIVAAERATERQTDRERAGRCAAAHPSTAVPTTTTANGVGAATLALLCRMCYATRQHQVGC